MSFRHAQRRRQLPWYLIGPPVTLRIMRSPLRRFLVLVLSVVLATGGMAHVAHAANMGAKAVSVMSTGMPADTSMPGECDGCGDQKGMAAAICFAYCSTFVALPLATAEFHSVAASILPRSADVTLSGRADPPDPYPPRPADLT
jgi:hypothetical protein